MPVGIPVDKSTLDQAVGGTARTLLAWAVQVKQLKAWIDATPDATLRDVPYSYSAPEVALLKSSITDMAQLVTLMEGGGALLTVKDFRAFIKQIAGILY